MGLELIIDTFITDIESGDFNVAALIGDDHACDWAYSIGLNRCFDHPELLIVGLDAEFAGALIELLGNEVASGRTISPGEEISVLDGLTMRAIPVDQLWLSRGEWFVLGQTVMSSWGQRWPETIQLLWSDESGEFPEVPGDPRWTFRQPRLSALHSVA